MKLGLKERFAYALGVVGKDMTLLYWLYLVPYVEHYVLF